jgi:hypothetical protein
MAGGDSAHRLGVGSRVDGVDAHGGRGWSRRHRAGRDASGFDLVFRVVGE